MQRTPLTGHPPPGGLTQRSHGPACRVSADIASRNSNSLPDRGCHTRHTPKQIRMWAELCIHATHKMPSSRSLHRHNFARLTTTTGPGLSHTTRTAHRSEGELSCVSHATHAHPPLRGLKNRRRKACETTPPGLAPPTP